MANSLEYLKGVGGSLKTCYDAANTLVFSLGGFGPAYPVKAFSTSENPFSPKQPTSRPSGLLQDASTGPNTRGGGCKTDSLKEAGTETLPASYQRREYACGFRWVRCAKGWDKRGLTRKTTSLFLGSEQGELFLGLLCSDLQGFPLPSY